MAVASTGPSQSSLNKNVRKYFIDAEGLTEDAPKWLSRREIPTSNEILSLRKADDDSIQVSSIQNVDLPQNKIRGKWKSREEYLSAHYELIREDVLGPFKEAIEDFRNGTPGKENNTFSLYDRVYIRGFIFAQQGIATRISFSHKRAGKKINWEQSKRLISGSLVALSPATDSFQTTCVIAVVAARPLEGVKLIPPEIDLFFATAEEMQLDPQKEWVMLESRVGYFEAARHTLSALQKLMTESFPLSEHLVRLRQPVAAPTYLQKNPFVNMSVLYPANDLAMVDVVHNWPTVPSKHLDASQWAALHQILTKRLAIVQGPPGTGKTYISVVALRVLLSNMMPGDPPIIIASQTNHALDQLLLHVSRFESNFVRLGGQTSDTGIIKDRTLYEVRRAFSPRDPPGCWRAAAGSKQRNLTKEIAPLLQAFQSDQPFPSTILRDLGLLTPKQHENLEFGAQQIVKLGAEEEKDSPMALWLGNNLQPFYIDYIDDNFGFEDTEEEDLEFEQLKELEAEQGLIDDDDREALRGQFSPIFEPFKCRKTAHLTQRKLDQLLAFEDLWKVPMGARGALYRQLTEKAKEMLLEEFRARAEAYAAATRNLKIGKMERDAAVLETVKLIGMTTTGLSKYRPLVSALKPRIVLVEEAAEIIEGPVTAACMESVEQLIIVGDHKQLQGHCAQMDLEGEPFYLDVSMFERLVNNGMPFKTLLRQRRMNPEIRRLLTPIYGELHDHEIVKSREDVPGMGGVNSFFFCHTWPETSDEYMSKCNETEANMVVEFFSYLYLNGMQVPQITVLTFYNGQRKRILAKLRKKPFLAGHYFKVVTVDSYQGEENEVVLLSLVRSNGRRNIGFLSVENRVCVAMSRARRGLYIFGNGENLCHVNRLWWEIVKIMARNPRRVGFHLPLECQNHQRKTWVAQPNHFDDLTAGCDRRCPDNMACGHQCPLTCHPFSHDIVQCQQRCRKVMPCDFNHRCTQPCYIRPCTCECFKRGPNLRQDLPPVPNELENVEEQLVQIEDEMDAVDTAVRPCQSPQRGSYVNPPRSSNQELKNKQKWVEFSAGGAVFHDAELDAKANTAHRAAVTQARAKRTESEHHGYPADAPNHQAPNIPNLAPEEEDLIIFD